MKSTKKYIKQTRKTRKFKISPSVKEEYRSKCRKILAVQMPFEYECKIENLQRLIFGWSSVTKVTEVTPKRSYLIFAKLILQYKTSLFQLTLLKVRLALDLDWMQNTS